MWVRLKLREPCLDFIRLAAKQLGRHVNRVVLTFPEGCSRRDSVKIGFTSLGFVLVPMPYRIIKDR
jgi:hypothetical protein